MESSRTAVRGRSATIPDSFCFADDFLVKAREENSDEKKAIEAQIMWEHFLQDCGVQVTQTAICQAVKVTVKRQLANCEIEAVEIPNGSGYDLSTVPIPVREELVMLVRKALEAFHKH